MHAPRRGRGVRGGGGNGTTSKRTDGIHGQARAPDGGVFRSKAGRPKTPSGHLRRAVGKRPPTKGGTRRGLCKHLFKRKAATRRGKECVRPSERSCETGEARCRHSWEYLHNGCAASGQLMFLKIHVEEAKRRERRLGKLRLQKWWWVQNT